MEEPPSTSASHTAANNRRNHHDSTVTDSNDNRQDGGPSSPEPSRYHRRGKNRSKGGARGGHTAPGNYTTGSDSPASSTHDIATRKPRPRTHRPKPINSGNTSVASPQEGLQTERASKQVPQPQQSRPRRAPRFNPTLTDQSVKPHRDTKGSTSSRKYDIPSRQDDLTSRLIHDLRTPPYPDCAICFNPIHPAQPTWSCSPSSPVTDAHSGVGMSIQDNEDAQCCWTTFHLKCIRLWADKSVKEVSEAFRARGEDGRCEWPCPGCRTKRLPLPKDYKCFCESIVDPKPPRLATPHSCGSPCSRIRECGHPCPIACHPGPCPPCQVTKRLQCYCTRKMLSFKCSKVSAAKVNGADAADLSCGNICSKMLDCGNHTCKSICHPGDCKPCEVKKEAHCYCGKKDAEIGCGEGHQKECEAENGDIWLGLFACDVICARPLDCGLHLCLESCHPSSKSHTPCSLSPALVTSCPCGKHPLVPSEAPHFPPGSKLARTSCTDPIPTCTSICMKPLPGCSHFCFKSCHIGPCPPCMIIVVRLCRCGMTRDVECYQNQNNSSSEILCDRPCTSLRACGKHQCNRVCCPLANISGGTKGKSKRRAVDEIQNDEQGWHLCDFVCEKLLTCGNHRCEEREHRGACPPCLRSSFEEIFCHCSRTVLEPPVPCGTTVSCRHPCDRPAPPCGHPNSKHSCHEDPTPCPPCPFLTSKLCGCGKKTVDNVMCSRQNVPCGTPCGKLMKCGFHRCEKLCHSDECGTCQSPCGKPRKSCLPAHHACTETCHAPSACPETNACRAIIDLTCPCGRIRHPVPCSRSTSQPSGIGDSQQIKCTNECAVAKRNARLAEALGISKESRTEIWKVNYSTELLAVARVNSQVCAMVEKSLADFVSSDKKSQVLTHMPDARRQFVQELALVYRIDTKVVDQEPHRSIQLIRRIDTRIPNPLLSIAATSVPSSSSYGRGKNAEMRTLSRPSPSPPMSKVVAPPPAATSSRGWTSVVVPSERPTPVSTSTRSKTPRVPIPVPDNEVQNPRSDHTPVNIPIHSEPVPDNWEEDT